MQIRLLKLDTSSLLCIHSALALIWRMEASTKELCPDVLESNVLQSEEWPIEEEEHDRFTYIIPRRKYWWKSQE